MNIKLDNLRCSPVSIHFNQFIKKYGTNLCSNNLIYNMFSAVLQTIFQKFNKTLKMFYLIAI